MLEVNQNVILLSQQDKEIILNKFPEDLRNKIKNVNNPLDQDEILVELFRDKNIRIVISIINDEFNNDEYISYFHVVDFCKLINYGENHIYRWKNANINTITYGELIKISKKYIICNNITNNKIAYHAKFVDSESLMKILIKINTPEANLFTDWIIQQSKIMKNLIKQIIKLKYELEKQKLQQEIQTTQQLIENNQNINSSLMRERTKMAYAIFTDPIKKSGDLYVGGTSDFTTKNIFKIGIAGCDLNKRKSSMRTGNPTYDMYFNIKCNDVYIAENIIKKKLENIQVFDGREFYYFPSLAIAKSFVSKVVNFVNDLDVQYGNLYEILQNDFINHNPGNLYEFICQNKHFARINTYQKHFINDAKIDNLDDVEDISQYQITLGK